MMKHPKNIWSFTILLSVFGGIVLLTLKNISNDDVSGEQAGNRLDESKSRKSNCKSSARSLNKKDSNDDFTKFSKMTTIEAWDYLIETSPNGQHHSLYEAWINNIELGEFSIAKNLLKNSKIPYANKQNIMAILLGRWAKCDFNEFTRNTDIRNLKKSELYSIVRSLSDECMESGDSIFFEQIAKIFSDATAEHENSMLQALTKFDLKSISDFNFMIQMLSEVAISSELDDTVVTKIRDGLFLRASSELPVEIIEISLIGTHVPVEAETRAYVSVGKRDAKKCLDLLKKSSTSKDIKKINIQGIVNDLMSHNPLALGEAMYSLDAGQYKDSVATSVIEYLGGRNAFFEINEIISHAISDANLRKQLSDKWLTDE